MKTNQSGRRSFISNVAIATASAISLPEIVLAAVPVVKSERVPIDRNDIILFQGDSITDAGRKKKIKDFNDQGALGGGYALLAASELLQKHPQHNLQVYNRGVSGNKVYQLADSWDTDAINLNPDVLSILVGVNDYWHTLSFGYKATVNTYRKDYLLLLERTKEKLPDVKLIIGEPFAIRGSVVNETWFPLFKEYQEVARELASDFNAAFIPYQKVFDQALTKAPEPYWSADGVHPSLAGAALMAHAWLAVIKSR